jgi:hypothetical protein
VHVQNRHPNRVCEGRARDAAAVTITAALPDLAGFSLAERQLLGEWLARIN